MAKERIPIPRTVAADAVFAADRVCCVCTLPGRPVQLHHIDEDPSNNDPANLAVLCLECHNQTQLSGGFGRHLDSAQIIRFRTDWTARVTSRRETADQLASRARSVSPTDAQPLSPAGLRAYVETLPELRRLAYASAQPSADTGSTYGSLEAGHIVLDVLKQILVTLCRYLPVDHADLRSSRDYISEEIANRARWHRYHQELGGLTGTIASPTITLNVVAEAERMVEDLVTSLCCGELVEGDLAHSAWLARWHQSFPEASDLGPSDA